jgi:hypothetical protein
MANKSPKLFLNRSRLQAQCCGAAADATDYQETYHPRRQQNSTISHRRATKRLEKWLPLKHS